MVLSTNQTDLSYKMGCLLEMYTYIFNMVL